MNMKNYLVFKSNDGTKLAYDPDKLLNTLLSYDGDTFYELYASGLSGFYTDGNADETITLTSPQFNFEGKAHRINNEIMFLGKKFILENNDPTIIPLPDDRQLEYLCASADFTFYVYVDASKYKYSYESFRVFIGDGKTMHQVKVSNVDRFRDGGTTFIKTNKGTLFCPSIFESDPQKQHTWNKNELVRISADDAGRQYKITEEDGGNITILKY